MRDKNCCCGVFMDKQTKSTIIELMKDCKTDEVYENILSELSDEKKIYAQCLWICRKYQFNRDQEKETKLNKIINRYGIDLDKIIEFTKLQILYKNSNLVSLYAFSLNTPLSFLISQNTNHIHNTKIPFFFFSVPFCSNFFIFKYLYFI